MAPRFITSQGTMFWRERIAKENSTLEMIDELNAAQKRSGQHYSQKGGPILRDDVSDALSEARSVARSVARSAVARSEARSEARSGAGRGDRSDTRSEVRSVAPSRAPSGSVYGSQYALVVMGLLLVLTVLLAPDGLVTGLVRLPGLLRRRLGGSGARP